MAHYVQWYMATVCGLSSRPDPQSQDTRTYSAEEEEDDQSSVRSFHTDSSGHEVEEFRLSRRSHMDLVRALEGRNSEVQNMRDRIKDLEVKGVGVWGGVGEAREEDGLCWPVLLSILQCVACLNEWCTVSRVPSRCNVCCTQRLIL